MAIPPDYKIRLEQLRNEMAARAEEQLRRQQAQQNAEKMSKQFVPSKASGGQPSMAVMRLAVGGQGPKNWLKGSVEPVLDPLLSKGMINNRQIPYGPEFDAARNQRIQDLKSAASQPGYTGGALKVASHLEEDAKNPRLHETAINKWVQGNLANYIRKQMATHDDPIRKLAEQGITHLPPDQMHPAGYQQFAEGNRKDLNAPRLGNSPEAQRWEDVADASIIPNTIERVKTSYPGQYEPWMDKADPQTNIWNTVKMHADYLGFDHIVDILKQDLAEGRIRPEQLNKVSIEQAVRRVHEYDQERKKAMEQTALKQTEGMPVHKDYGDGFKWIELSKPEVTDEDENSHLTVAKPEGRKDFAVLDKNTNRFVSTGHKSPEDAINHIKNIGREKRLADALKYEGDTMGHCVGGYCPDVIEGRSRIFSLRDAKNEPHVTIEVRPQRLNDPSKPIRSGVASPELMAQYQDYFSKSGQHSMHFAEGFWPWLKEAKPEEYERMTGEQPAIIQQIKGKQNAKPKKDYIPYVQDFVKSGEWSDVKDKQNAEIRDITKTPTLHGWLKDNNVPHDRYLTEQEYTKHESDMLANKLGIDSSKPQGMAKGGQPSLDTMRLALNNQRMYSPLEKAAMAVPRTKGTPAEFMAEVSKQPGFRKDEVADRGVTMPGQKMTKPEFVQHLQSHPAPKLIERVLGGNDYQDELNNAAQYITGDEDASFDDLNWNQQKAVKYDVANNWGYNPETQYEEHTLPGGDNYREVLLMTPKKGLSDREREQKMWIEANARRGELNPKDQAHLEELTRKDQQGAQDYQSHHWKDHPNVLAHIRMSDRRGPNGEKILHVEEIQSDWHQRGRKEGYYTPEQREAAKQAMKEWKKGRQGALFNGPDQFAKEHPEHAWINRATPDAPFKKNWHELAMKHVLGMAANGKYHGIAITPGEEQEKRWEEPGLRVQYDKTLPEFLNKLGKPHGAQVGTIPLHDIPPLTRRQKEDPENVASHEAMKATPLHYFPITDSLRQQITQEGLPQYDRGGMVN